MIRYLNGTHERASSKLSALTNPAYISQKETGERQITDYDARQIEKLLSLLDGWMDRDHAAMFGMSKVDYAILSSVTARPDAAKAGLLAFLTTQS